jgi:4-hydroxy-3-polyprenylbenzoate decarboxylase
VQTCWPGEPAPLITWPLVVTADPAKPDAVNLGIYRMQVTGRNTTLMRWLAHRGGAEHHAHGAARGDESIPAAAVIGADPATIVAAVAPVPEALSEYQFAGLLRGKPVELVECRSVPLRVPAEAEIVIEGYISTELLEPEAPFGESHGHVNLQEFNAFMDVTCITRRRDAIVTSIISQVTPSESSCIKQVAYETIFLNHLRDALGIKGVKKVALHEPLTNIRKLVVVVCDRDMPRTEVWRALYGAATLLRAGGKFVIAVNDDIDPSNADALFWAMAYRCNPILDMQVLPHRDQGHGPRSKRNNGEDGSVLYDATLKENFPPISLPKREFMENAAKIWDELGLPALKPQEPWFGYSLGEWDADFDEAAEMATRSEYWAYGERIAQRRRSDVAMNTEVRDVDETK